MTSWALAGAIVLLIGFAIWMKLPPREPTLVPQPPPAPPSIPSPAPATTSLPAPPPVIPQPPGKPKPSHVHRPPVHVQTKPSKAPTAISIKTAPSVAVSVTHPPKTAVPMSVPPVLPRLPTPVSPPPEAEVHEWHGNDTSVTHEGQVVVRTDEQWVHFWSEHHPHEVAPDVDFSRNMVIGIFVGRRPAEQFAVQILNVRPLPNAIVVDYRQVAPPPGTLAIDVSVYPYALKVIPKTNLPVKFNELR